MNAAPRQAARTRVAPHPAPTVPTARDHRAPHDSRGGPPTPRYDARVRRDLRPGLIVPTLLAVSAFGPACSGDDEPPTTDPTATSAPLTTGPAPTTGETGGETTAADTTDAPTTATTGETGSTTATTTTDTTGGDTTTGGELPDCDPYPDEAACEAAEGCTWFFETGACIIDCSLLTDEATCDAAMICFWGGDTCFPPI